MKSEILDGFQMQYKDDSTTYISVQVKKKASIKTMTRKFLRIADSGTVSVLLRGEKSNEERENLCLRQSDIASVFLLIPCRRDFPRVLYFLILSCPFSSRPTIYHLSGSFHF